MNMTVWNPLKEMESILDRYHRNLNQQMDNAEAELGFAKWSPTVDIEENDSQYLIRADVPGVDKKDIDVRLENGMLSISGEKKIEKETGKGTKHHRTERYSGSFSRSFTLPTAIKADDIDASYKDGVLSLKIPKAEEAKAKAIDIKVS